MADSKEESMNREIPVFTVLKNDCILKNIYLLDNPPSVSPSNSINFDQDSEIGETMVMGRHPDCNIRLDHPSISRFHLRILSKPFSRSLFVTDLSSVHGTWISGKRIEAGVSIKLNDGDTLQLGGSTRLYRLHWVPLHCAYDVENSLVPQMDSLDTVEKEEKTQGEIFQDKNRMSCSDFKSLELLHSDVNSSLSMQNIGTSLPLKPENFYVSFSKEVEVEGKNSLGGYQESDVYIQLYQVDKDNDIVPSAVVPQIQSHIEDVKNSGLKSENKADSSIWSRRGKLKTVQIETKWGSDLNSHPPIESSADEKYNESILIDTLASLACEEEILTPEKENLETFGMELKNGLRLSISEDALINLDNGVDEIFTPDKENCFPGFCSNGSLTSKADGTCQIFTPDKENCFPSFCSESLTSKAEELCQSNLRTPLWNLDQEEEIFTPNKENITPKTRLLSSMKNLGNLEGVDNPSSSSKSSLMRNANSCILYQGEGRQTQDDNQKQHTTSSRFESVARLKKEPYVLKSKADRTPFQLLPMNSGSNYNGHSHSISSVCEGSMMKAKYVQYSTSEEVIRPHGNFQTKLRVEEKKGWTIVVDMACLLNKKSRKELQLMRGLKSTHLVIPRIVISELDCKLRRGNFFRKRTEVYEALRWIDDSMENTKWWIHVQTSAEAGMIIPPTPPASYGSNPFSPYSLQEIVTPSSEDNVLECAIFIKQNKTAEQLVLLSNDVTLKIKAMAEGIICESPEEFRRSLVNPFSKRFLYTDSAPRGCTWTFEDDNVLKEKYYPSPTKKLSKSGGGVKGLKLLLLHKSGSKENRSTGQKSVL